MAEALVPTTLPGFASRFSTEEACAAFLFDMRWPNGFVCPRCGSEGGYPIAARSTIECASPTCRYHASLTAGTIMHRSKQDLCTWFWAVYLVTSLTPGISAVQFQKQLGLSRYETAFNMLHKLRSALVAPGRDPLHGEVEIDEGYVGGEEEGRPGRGAETKALVVCAVELVRWTDSKSGKARVRTGRARLRVVPDASAESLVPFVRDSVERGAVVHTDGWSGYGSLGKSGYDHRPVPQGRGKNAKYMPHVHRIISNLKTWLLGTHHGRVNPKHLQAYLNEFTFRFNRRFWRGPAIRRALALAVQAEDRPTYRSLYEAGTDLGWTHPSSHELTGGSGLSAFEADGQSTCPESTG